MEFLELLLEVMAKTLNMDKTGVAELVKSEDGKVKPEALQTLMDKFTEHLKKVKADGITEGVKKTTRIEREALEKEMKEALGLTTDKKGVDLALFIKEQTEASVRDSGKELTDDVVKKHPLYLSLERLQAQEKANFLKEKDESINALKKEYQEKETFQTVAQKALKRVMDKNPILPVNAEVAETLKNVFLEKLKSNGFSLEGEKINILKDGENLKDNLGHIVEFEKYVDDLSSKFFEFKKAEGRSSSGADKGDAGGKGKDQKLDVPKTKDEFNKAYFAETDQSKRVALKNAFDEEQKALADAK